MAGQRPRQVTAAREWTPTAECLISAGSKFRAAGTSFFSLSRYGAPEILFREDGSIYFGKGSGWMADMHITSELLEAIARGEISVRVLEEMILEHLKKVCPHCKRELEEFARKQEAERRGKSPGLAFDSVSAVLDRYLRDLQRGQDRARRDVEKLLTIPREQRAATIKRSRTRYRGRQVVWILLKESRTLVTVSPDEAEHLAQIARLVVQYSPGDTETMDLLALATALMANACRAAGKLEEAESHFEYARSLVTHQGVTNTEILARIDHLEGSLRMEQHNFRDAEKLLSRAAMLFSVAGETVERARALIKMGYMYFLQGELIRAIETTRAGLVDLPGREKYLYLCGRYNLARFLTESGQYREATAILEADEELHREFPEPWTQLRLVWLRGKIEAGRGDEAAAEQCFLAARAGFLGQRNAYDAAMVSLEDLAVLYLRQGRTAEVRQLAEEMVAVFQEQNLPDDALRALRLCAAAARREELTAVMARGYAAEIRQIVARRANGMV
jgi:tetratricopeptide (TPR) repeat protein